MAESASAEADEAETETPAVEAEAESAATDDMSDKQSDDAPEKDEAEAASADANDAAAEPKSEIPNTNFFAKMAPVEATTVASKSAISDITPKEDSAAVELAAAKGVKVVGPRRGFFRS